LKHYPLNNLSHSFSQLNITSAAASCGTLICRSFNGCKLHILGQYLQIGFCSSDLLGSAVNMLVWLSKKMLSCSVLATYLTLR
jgi:hypothetical protein